MTAEPPEPNDPLLDPDRLDLQDPLTILINQQEATDMTTIEKKERKHGGAQTNPPSPD